MTSNATSPFPPGEDTDATALHRVHRNFSMWLDELKPEQSWLGSGNGLGHCTVCSGAARLGRISLRALGDAKRLGGTAREEGFGPVQSAPANEGGAFLEPVDLFEGE